MKNVTRLMETWGVSEMDFADAAEVREYFTLENARAMFGPEAIGVTEDECERCGAEVLSRRGWEAK